MKKGDFVEIDFVGRVSSTGEVFDLTTEEDAKKEGIHNPKHKYKPALVVVGSGMAVHGVEQKLEHMEVGQEEEFTLSPEEAFGQRNMSMIRVLSMSKFIKEKISPVPGMFVDIDGMQTKILSVAGGRVRVDFNHPLSGKVLRYKVRVVRHITETGEKVSLLLSYYGIKCESRLDGSNLVLETDKPMNEFLKKFASETVLKWIPEVKNISFTHKEPAPAKPVEKHEHGDGHVHESQTHEHEKPGMQE